MSTTHTASTSTSRVKQVAISAAAFFEGVKDDITLKEIEEFASSAQANAERLSREVQGLIKEQDLGEMTLTDHAAHMRTISANIVLLRDGLVPALKIDGENPKLRTYAVQSMAYLWAQNQAMEMGIL